MKRKISTEKGNSSGRARTYRVHSAAHILSDSFYTICAGMDATAYAAFSVSYDPFLFTGNLLLNGSVTEPLIIEQEAIAYAMLPARCYLSTTTGDTELSQPGTAPSQYDLHLVRCGLNAAAFELELSAFVTGWNRLKSFWVGVKTLPIGNHPPEHRRAVEKLHFSVHGCHNIIHGPPYPPCRHPVPQYCGMFQGLLL